MCSNNATMKVYIVIVAFNPDNNHLAEMIAVIKKCGYIPVIVDNSDDKMISENVYLISEVIDLNGNKGIAFAQNQGIRYAISNGADVIGFFDQDSEISENLIKTLVQSIKDKGIEIAAPRSIDAATGKEYPSQRVGKNGIPKDVYTDYSKTLTKVDIAISSGTFVKKEVFEKIGMFDEALFIDFVDIEWCLRCYKAGIPIWIVRDAEMKHTIGNNTKSVGLFVINVHSPYRTYYKVRNAFLIFRKKAGFKFSITQLIPAIFHNSLLMFDPEHGKEYRKYYLRGIIDGLRNKDGKYEQWHDN